MHPGDSSVSLRGLCLATGIAFTGMASVLAKTPPNPGPPPIRALLVTGGASHDYATRQEVLTRGIRERVARPIEWVVRMQGLGDGGARIPLFESAEWAKDCDIVVHDHCFPRVRDTGYVDRILAPHRAGLPAVLLHGSMMSFRTGDERWFDFTGVTTRSHERARAVRVETVKEQRPRLAEFSFWEIPREELYRVETSKEGISAVSKASDPAGRTHLTTWTHRYGPSKTKVFATTLGNELATVADAKYLDLISRGFLWALGESLETTFRDVPETDSLKGFTLRIPAIPLPRPGRNAAREGEVSAFSWGGSDPGSDEVGKTIDGDPETSWFAPTPGPGAWTLTWEQAKKLSALLLYWSGPSCEILLEGSADGRDWAPLGSPVSVGPSDRPVLHEWPQGRYRGLRVSVPALPPGAAWGLREVAVYEDRSAVPAAVLVKLPRTPLPSSGDLRPAGESEFLRRIHLAPGWSVTRVATLPGDGSIGALVPAASGGVFLSLFPKGGGAGEVNLALPSGEAGLEFHPYLSGIEPETSLAWDGEWLYTLSGPRLDRVRRALGQGPADERQRLGVLFEFPATGAPVGAKIRDLSLGDDGWLRARISAEKAGNIISREGRPISWPRDGMLRFSTRGRGLSVERVAAESSDGDLPDGGRIEGAFVRRDDGREIWISGGDGGGGNALICLAPVDPPPPTGVDWNEIPTASLSERLLPATDDLRSSERREAALEWQRRKHPDDSALPEWPSGAETTPGAARLYVTAVAGGEDRGSRDRFVSLLENADPAIRAAAFASIGDFPDVSPAIFSALGEVTIPQVSAAIFDGLRRSGTSLPGAEMVAMGLLDHQDQKLSAAAFDLLLARRAVPLAVQTLGEENARLWPGAFQLLRELPGPESVGGLIACLDRQRDPVFRRVGLETLAALYPAMSPGHGEGETAARIARYLSARVNDSRVDRASLLEAMETHGLPAPTPGQLFELGSGDLRFLGYALDGLLASSVESLPEEAVPWLMKIATDDSHDPAIRHKAGALIAGFGNREGYRQWFTETLRIPSESPRAESAAILRDRWWGREDHAAQADWLFTQTRHRDPRGRALAWTTLIAAWPSLEKPGLEFSLIKDLALAIQATGEGSDVLRSELASMPPSFIVRFLKATEKQADASAVSARLAALHSLEPTTGEALAPIAEASIDELVKVVGTGNGDVDAGALAFVSYGCVVCHNVQGEGPATAPDLLRGGRDLSELVKSIARPAEPIKGGYELRPVSIEGGGTFLGWSQVGLGQSSEWVDAAGNLFEIERGDAASAGPPAGSPCGPNRPISRPDWGDLLTFLKDLAP